MKQLPAFAQLRRAIVVGQAISQERVAFRMEAAKWTIGVLAAALGFAIFCVWSTHTRIDDDIAGLKSVTAQRDSLMQALQGLGFQCEKEADSDRLDCALPSAQGPHFIPNSGTIPEVTQQ